jgi:hypothetical protein
LPTLPHVIKKVTVHPKWPSFTVGRGATIKYGPEICPRTLDILRRFAGVSMDPKFTEQDCQDIIKAIRKVYPAVMRA